MRRERAPMTTAEALLRERLSALEPVSVEVSDDGADHIGHANEGRGHFSVVVVSNRFCGMSRLHRHQAVYDLVRDLIPSTIHALSIKALAPEELR
jgi:BolA protein